MPWTVDHGLGLLRAFICQIWTLLKELGPQGAGGGPWIEGLLDWLAEVVGWSFVGCEPIKNQRVTDLIRVAFKKVGMSQTHRLLTPARFQSLGDGLS